jgi:dipeptidyl aminopeptidase/acylaminoacyl peptidase
MRMLLALSAVIVLTRPLMAGGRPLTVDDLLAVKGVSDPQVSPDGKLVAYVVSEIDRAANKTNSSLWVVPTEGGDPKRLTTTPGTNNHPRWSPDGKTIAFVSDRGGSPQVWLLPTDGGEPRQLTRLPIGVSGPIWSPNGDKIAFTAEVYPGASPEETSERDKKKGEEPSKARVYDNLMFRHWNVWDEAKRSHLFVCDAESGEAKDLIPDWKANVPPAPFGGSSDYAWSPDGAELAFTSEPLSDHATSTNTDIWTVPADGGEAKNITADNKGADAQPGYSPDGTFLGWVRQVRPGFEADLNVLALRNRESGQVTEVTRTLDRPVQSWTWDPSADRTIVAVLDHEGTEPIVRFHVGPNGGAHFAPDLKSIALVKGGTNTAPSVSPKGRAIAFVRSAANRPAEIRKVEVGPGSSIAQAGEPVALTHHNDELVAELDLPAAESFRFEGADGATVQGWLVKPPGFDASKSYPVAFLIHGGPQSAWHDEWHNRWNFALFAAPGYCVVAINPRGSPGFGQQFTDEISQDWGGRVTDDLLKGLEHALKEYKFLDGDRVAAAGGSFGGYMVNWLAGHTDRFRCLVSHAGIFDLTSMNVTTEELWFSTWEFGGFPWDTPELHMKQSPSTYVRNFRTPTLVIHGALDYRVPDAQGIAMYTALQSRGVPSRFVWFPDEGHWITKPANRVVWWREVHGWLAKYLKPGES